MVASLSVLVHQNVILAAALLGFSPPHLYTHIFTSPFISSHLHFVRVEVRININADVDVDVCVDVDVADSDGVDVMICRLTAGHCWLELCWQLENWFCHHASLTLFHHQHHHCNHHHHQYHPLHKKAPFQRK